MSWMKPSIDIDEDSIKWSHAMRSKRVLWSDVKVVYGEKIDKLTYEELFIIITDSEGRSISAGELDQGFGNLEREIMDALPGFPNDWRGTLETVSPGCRMTLWKKGCN